MTGSVCAHPSRIDSDIELICEISTIDVPGKCRRAMVGSLEILSPCLPGSAPLRRVSVARGHLRSLPNRRLRLFTRRRPATSFRRNSCEPILS
jgi:hypothetical protein